MSLRLRPSDILYAESGENARLDFFEGFSRSALAGLEKFVLVSTSKGVTSCIFRGKFRASSAVPGLVWGQIGPHRYCAVGLQVTIHLGEKNSALDVAQQQKGAFLGARDSAVAAANAAAIRKAQLAYVRNNARPPPRRTSGTATR